MKTAFRSIETEVQKALKKYRWELLTSRYEEESGNWVFEFKNPAFRLRLKNDRGAVFLQVFDDLEWVPGERYFNNLKIETVVKNLEENHDEIQEDIFSFLSKILMNLNALEPIKFEEEMRKGKIPVFLERHEIEFLCDEWRKIPFERLKEEHRETWYKIAFKGQASLHRNGLLFEPTFPVESEKYK